MKKVIPSTQFRRAFKRYARNAAAVERIERIVSLLCTDGTLPANARPHSLVGKYAGWFECHVMPDLLLIYDTTPEAVFLQRLGSHSELFG